MYIDRRIHSSRQTMPPRRIQSKTRRSSHNPPELSAPVVTVPAEEEELAKLLLSYCSTSTCPFQQAIGDLLALLGFYYLLVRSCMLWYYHADLPSRKIS